jgi:hypothetical protein
MPVSGEVTKTFSGVGVTPGRATPPPPQPVRAKAVATVVARTRAKRETFMEKV